MCSAGIAQNVKCIIIKAMIYVKCFIIRCINCELSPLSLCVARAKAMRNVIVKRRIVWEL